VNTFDAKGNLLGDDAPVGTPDNPMPLDTMTVTAAPPSFLDSLLQPPLVYFLVIGIGIAAYLYERDE
jgi:hypothetical protein